MNIKQWDNCVKWRGKKNNEKNRFKNAQKFTRCYNLLCDIRLTSSNNNLFTHTHRGSNPGGLHQEVHSSFLYPLFSCIVFDKLILYHPGSHLSTHRWSFSVQSQHCGCLDESDVILEVVTFSL